MPKIYKYLLYFGGFLSFLLILFIILHALSASKPTLVSNGTTASSTFSNLPGYILPDESDVRKFVENFVILYNTYSYGDYSNLTALGDYQTPELQQKTLDLVSRLQNSTPAGYSVVTNVDDSSFSYIYPEATQAFISLNGSATQSQGGHDAVYSFTASLSLQKSGNNWLVSNITYTRN